MLAPENWIRCYVQDVNINKSLLQFLYIFVGITYSTENNPYHFETLRQPTQMLWLVRTNCLSSHQSYHRDSMNPKQNLQGKGRKWPKKGATWIHFGSDGSLSFSLLLLDWNGAVKTWIRYLIPTYFSNFFIFVKSKGKRTPSLPNRLSCAHVQGVTWPIGAGEEQRHFEIAPKFTSSWGIRLNSIMRKWCPYLIAYFHRRLLHILWIIPSIFFLSFLSQNLNMLVRINEIERGKLINNLHIYKSF